MKIKIWYCAIDHGDGSMSARSFRTMAEAEACEAEELEMVGRVPCDAVYYDIMDIDGYEVVA